MKQEMKIWQAVLAVMEVERRVRECDVRQNGIKITRDTKNYHALFSYMLGINTMMPLNNFVGTHTKKHKQFYFERKMWR
jgi:hypothetical protein